MTDSFEAWINGMSDEDYEEFIDSDGTDLQVEKALNIRTPPSKQDEEDLEALQYGEEPEDIQQSRVEQIAEPEIVYDNRDLPPERRNVTIEIPRDGTPARVLPRQTQYETRSTTINPPQLPQQPQPPQQTTFRTQPPIQTRIQPQQVTRLPRQSFTQRIRTSFSNIASRLNPFRRNKK